MRHNDSGGNGELSFDSDHGPLPYVLDPVTEIQTVEVRDASGVVLSGSF